MRINIGKRIYDTDTAKLMRTTNMEFFNCVRLYKKKSGEFFVYKERKDGSQSITVFHSPSPTEVTNKIERVGV